MPHSAKTNVRIEAFNEGPSIIPKQSNPPQDAQPEEWLSTQLSTQLKLICIDYSSLTY
jgi:hypothetical protein